MKVISINFQPIKNGKCGNALIHYIFRTFCQMEGDKFFLTSSVDKKYAPNIIGHSQIVATIIKIFVIIAKKLHIPYYLIRSWCEIVVDYQHSLYLKKQKPPYILITSMYSRKCTKIAKDNGCKTILIAGNLNDEVYYNAVTKEQKRLKLKYTDVYSSKYRIGIYRTMMTMIDEVWANSDFSAKTFEGKTTKIIPISYYETRGYTPQKNTNNSNGIIRIGYIGHTTLLKGVHLLVEAVNKCKYKNSIKIVLVGSIDKHVSDLLSRSATNIVYLGVVKEEEKESIIKSFDLMVVPSLYDAGPTTIYEGCECNVPMLVSDGCGGAELIQNNKGCIIFRTMDIDDLVSKIEHFYECQQTYKSVGSYMHNKFGEDSDKSNFEILKNAIGNL